MSGTLSSTEAQGIYKSLWEASDATSAEARSKSLEEADALLRANTVSKEDIGQVSAKLSCEGKLGKLIIEQYGTSDSAQGQSGALTEAQLKARADGTGGESPTQKVLAEQVAKNFDQIDADKSTTITGAEVEAWANAMPRSGQCATASAEPGAPENPFDPRFSTVTPPNPGAPIGFDKRFAELRKPLGFDQHFQELRRPPHGAQAAPPVIPQNLTPPESPSPQQPESSTPEKPKGFEKRFDELRQAPGSSETLVRSEKWGNRNFEVGADGAANYKVKAGDTVWSVATDVLSHRLSRQPSNAEILKMSNSISEASGLRKQGRNPDLIYADKDVLKIPPQSSERRSENSDQPENQGRISPVPPPQERSQELQPRRRPESLQPQSQSQLDKAEAAKALRGLAVNDSALIKKVLELQGKDDPGFAQTKTALTALQVFSVNDGAVSKKLAAQYPEMDSKGVSKEELEQFSKDSKNNLTPVESNALKYIVTNFSTYSPDDDRLTRSDIQSFVSKTLGLKKETLSKMIGDNGNGLSQDDRNTLGFFEKNFAIISPNDNILEITELKAFAEQYVRAVRSPGAQPNSPGSGNPRR